MVAKIICGKSIKGAIWYNERKVQQEKALQLLAHNFPSEQLSLLQKAGRFEALTVQNRACKTNAVHISLNFDPTEQPDDFTLRQIAASYLDKIGFAGQPYLLYRHYDAAHPHVHIVTTNIKDGGKRIPLHNIGRNQSEKARKEIEQEFNLVPAEGRNQEQEMYLKPAALEKALYGKSETKATISNIVREVVINYKYSSLAELNAILGLYNVTADRGSEGTKMFDKGGLVYSLLDTEGKKIGVPIKSSSIYSQPKLSELEKRFVKNKETKKGYKEGIKRIIDTALKTDGVTDKDTFALQMEREGISVLFRQNEQGRIYGITFVDHVDKVVFNGSDLHKGYSAGNILQRILQEQKTELVSNDWNEQYVHKALAEIDYRKGFPFVLTHLYQKGIRVSVHQGEGTNQKYLLGHYRIPIADHWEADKKWSAYFAVNGMHQELSSALTRQKKLYQRTDSGGSKDSIASRNIFTSGHSTNQFLLQRFVENFLNAPASYEGPVQQVPQKKKKKRKI